jgi:hypothetical protein
MRQLVYPIYHNISSFYGCGITTLVKLPFNFFRSRICESFQIDISDLKLSISFNINYLYLTPNFRRAYTPVPEDVDHVLVFEVTAKYKNGKVLTKSTTTKEAAKALQTPPARTEWILHKDSTETGRCLPKTQIFISFHELTNLFPYLEREHLIKLCTYNILAPIWTNPANCDWCPAWALEWSYRRAIILKELLAYDADIICLQVSNISRLSIT